jgi:hypothetical protein
MITIDSAENSLGTAASAIGLPQKALETQFTSRGKTYRQLFRKNDVAVYDTGTELELIFIRVKPATEFPDGRSLPERECYPSDAEWGNRGWSFSKKRQDYVVGFAQKLAGMTKGRYELVGKCMRSNRYWRRYLGPLKLA